MGECSSFLPLFFSQQHDHGKDEGRDANSLGYGEIAGNQKAPGIAAEKFDNKAGHGIKEQIVPDDGPLEALFSAHEN